MKALLISSLAIISAACSNHVDDHYWCSYETDPEVHKQCLEVGKDLDEHTAKSAGGQVE
ncbi:hypothetical protein QWI17_19790 [Gilvimarinus sp. SDUM040013]|uniref:Uncharacterized protein n=1 Tax=Gilvimarinus gilvus TaxID=3058038 RepID=A0ABU4RZN7_9GAMM|nr:hypothetical protein [Gilvimarinus sp. SDUM040013]MDO3388098.1 hypothetical protein [Gilvimarinus sp. SDUM040013]MDX6850327.1 hypothetical protein [Gilvimarinus sp. SDUM040013]